MTIIKLTILIWVINLVSKFYVKRTIDKDDIESVLKTGKVAKMTPARWIYVLSLLFGLIGIVASVVYLLFFLL